MTADLQEIERNLHRAIYGMTRLSADRTDVRETLRQIVAMWDDLAAGRKVDGDDAKALMERARRLVGDGQ